MKTRTLITALLLTLAGCQTAPVDTQPPAEPKQATTQPDLGIQECKMMITGRHKQDPRMVRVLLQCNPFNEESI